MLIPALRSLFTDSDVTSLVNLRRDLHQHPELSWKEQRTSTKLAEVSGTGYVDAGAGGPGRAFYQVRAHFPAGYAEGSTTVGKKVTPLYKGYTKLGFLFSRAGKQNIGRKY